ncbi:MAG: sigma-54-dependent transcriptional regulator [Acidiferrobacteraceae bacterium]
MANVLIVDDDRKIRLTLRIFLERKQHRVRDVASVSAAINALKEFHADLVLTDLKMEPHGGLDLLRCVKAEYPRTPVVIMTAYGAIDTAVEAIKTGASDFIVKPFAPAEIEQIVTRNLHIRGLEAENQSLRRAIEHGGLFTRSPALKRTLAMVEQFGKSDVTILIQGESGTGKSMLARHVHRLTARASSPFIEVNCGSLSPALLESELFGHCKGAFTGAIRDKIGRLELADQGTLFLDEISELDMGGQAKLLRFLQDKVFERVGESKIRTIGARIIAASNKNLQELVAQLEFRDDLYYRLNVAEIVMPPLRERIEDVPLLARQFLLQAATRHGLAVAPTIDEPVLDALCRYRWPGNVRELLNVIERCVILAREGRVTLDHLPDRLQTRS